MHTHRYIRRHTHMCTLFAPCVRLAASTLLSRPLPDSLPPTHSYFFLTLIVPSRTLLDADMTNDEVTALNLGKEWTVRAF